MARVSVNGVAHDVDVPGDQPLLWVLRERLGLPATKFGCGIGQCGACTVLVDGQAIRSCQLPVGQVTNAEITTLEGLEPAGEHPVQLAWIEEQVPQCGYCQTGQIMSATALLAQTDRPTNADIDRAMSGNVCRCGAYGAIRRAIHRAADLKAASIATEDAGSGGDR